jgi:eukaryotic-like serine/threonine-protein kinase
MAFAAGTRLGPYEILASVGAGGMGEVYRAKDTRLSRIVAVKVLPTHLSSNPDLRQRFEREARAVSSLNHPNICTLHDIGHQDGIDFLVMEFLEGETLADRLSKGPLPLEQTLRYGMQIADALEKAHKQGIVHRDLKPGNIMLTKSGAKLLDFGLAKFAIREASDALSRVATEDGNLTAEGTILGTVQYMAPEQLEGSGADARTDIFALGAVLYEMVTGKKAFTGKSRASLITAIMSKDPEPISNVQPMTPRALDRLVRISLAKDPDARWQTAHDVMLEIQGVSESISQPEISIPATTRRKKREWLPWLVAGLFALAAIGFGTAYFKRSVPAEQQPLIELSILPPAENAFSAGTGPIAISPDGKYAAFLNNSDGRRTLWLRPMNSAEARQLPGTDNSNLPFWSPDSQYVAFFSKGKLMKIAISGGRPQPICDAQLPRGGSWGTSGIIIFADRPDSPILQVPASGGTPKPATKLNQSLGEVTHRWPFFLPDGRRFLYLVRITMKNQAIYAGSLDSSETKLVMSSNSKVAYSPPGYLLYTRESRLMAQSFDLKTLEVKGEPIPILKEIVPSPTGQASFSPSDNGMLAYWSSNLSEVQLNWLDRDGRNLGAAGQTVYTGDFRYFRISPDGSRVVWTRADPDVLTPDVWVTDFARNVSTRLTSNPAFDQYPIWEPDGKSIAFGRDIQMKEPNLFLIPSSGAGGEEVMIKDAPIPTDWSSDGKYILGIRTGKRTDLWITPLSGDQKSYPFLETEFDEAQGAFSPNRKWIAYISDEAGDYDVYVQSFPPSGKKWRISADGGAQPRWRGDGKELFYLSRDRKIMAVEVSEQREDFVAGVPRALFKTPMSSPAYPIGADYDVMADGQQFLVSSSVNQNTYAINVILNWTELLHQK